MSAIQTDAANTPLSVDDATEALLSRWSKTDEDAEKPSVESEPEDEDNEKDVEEQSDDSEEDAEKPSEDETDEDDSETDEENDEDDDKPKSKRELDDNTIVKIKVDGEEIEAKVSDLKRLYGQEAALTKKSQAVSAKLKEADEANAKYTTALGSLLQRAKERAEPYAKIDWLVASRQLTDDELTALRTEAQKTFDDVNFFQQELDGVMQQNAQRQHAMLIEQARETVEVLKTEIPGWNEKVYDEIRTFAISSGFDRDVINSLVDPVAIKVLHQAMLYNKGKQAVTTKKNKSPKKLVKSTASAESTRKVISASKDTDAVSKLKRTGSVEDATEALLARWAANED